MSREIPMHDQDEKTIGKVTARKLETSKKDINKAQRRWRLLARALQRSPDESSPENGDEISVRRFASFDLVIPSPIENTLADPDSTWYDYRAVLEREIYTVEIRRINKKSFTANELMGFNNTGNVCVWPSEECLAYYLLKKREVCRNKMVLELGGGMSCLAGLYAAKYCEPAGVTLTDGNVTSVDNVRCIVARNNMADFVKCGVVQWARAAATLRQGNTNVTVSNRIQAVPGEIVDIAKLRADYWKSQGRKFCDFCKCWIADNKPSIEFHEGGKKHKDNVGKRLKEIHKNSAKQAKQSRKFEDDLKKMENAAMAAYLKDVESNNVDLTAEKIIRDKLNNPEKREPIKNPNQMPSAAPDTIPRYSKNRTYRDDRSDVDYCDPYAEAKRRNHQQAKLASQGVGTSSGNAGENKPQGKGNKGTREKRKGKKHQEERVGNGTHLQKLWYEALTPEGYTYYWHIETNESVWEVPAEGYMSIAEQEEEAKEQAIQEEFLEQIEKESAKEKADLLEERRANEEREKLREFRKQKRERRKKDDKETRIEDEVKAIKVEIKEEVESDTEEKIPYRRDYSVPEKPEPYGPWQTVQILDQKPVDLQLPKKKAPLAVPSLNKDPALTKRIFTEKVVTTLSAGDSDDDKAPTTFKKRKIGAKNVRKRFDNE